MHIVTRKHPAGEESLHKEAAAEIRAWTKTVLLARWRSFPEVRQTFKDADQVDGYVVFNIRHNRYRLVTVIHYAGEKDGRITEGHVYIRAFLAQKEYDSRTNWDKGVNQ